MHLRRLQRLANPRFRPAVTCAAARVSPRLPTTAVGTASAASAAGAARVRAAAMTGVRAFSSAASKGRTADSTLVNPLLDRVIDAQAWTNLRTESLRLPEVVLNRRQLCDLELLLNGGFSPLNGFMKQQNYDSVIRDMRLSEGSSAGALWPMPITLDLNAKQLAAAEAGWAASGNGPSGTRRLALKDGEGNTLAVLDVEQLWKPNKQIEADGVFGKDPEHPANRYLFGSNCGDTYVGGRVHGLQLPIHYDYHELRHTPRQLRAFFALNKGWENVVAFQTRNPLHRAHFELTQRAIADGKLKLLLHPVVGETKPGDIDHHTRVKCYRAIMSRYAPNTALLSALPLAMRMGGPREALWHALIRQNYGATHFILGRDHAGPGSNSKGVDFYTPYQARDFALKYANELSIQLLPFDMMVYAPQHACYFPLNAVPKGAETKNLSGTEVRRRLANGSDIPEWFSWPEVVSILRRSYPPKLRQGFCIFFTGLSGSGKTTVANALLERLMELTDRKITMLDGDFVRSLLSSELGFSVEHRNLNVKRIGFVAGEVVKAGGIVIAALIAPYKSSRVFAREQVSTSGGFVEVYLNTALETCERRDRKGLYKKARAGVLPNFTGISDPYEAPVPGTDDADLVLDTSEMSVHEAALRILEHLQTAGYLPKEADKPIEASDVPASITPANAK